LRKPPARVFFLAYDQCDELDIVGPFAVLQTANRYLADPKRSPAGVPIDLRIVATANSGAVTYDGPDGPHAFVTGVHGMTLEVNPWDGRDLPDILIVAGGNIEPDTGIARQMQNPAFVEPLRRQHARGAQLVSVCTGALGIVGAGLASGRMMTTHPGIVNELAAAGARVLHPDWEARVVDDGDLISCGGVTSGIDEALYLVRSFWPGDPQLIADVRGFVDFNYRAHIAVGAPMHHTKEI
jgi:transcriptional regulator GlxA family with amidase domain